MSTFRKSSYASRGTGVYVHFPWCLRKCPYCDFATQPLDRVDIPARAYTNALLREVELRSAVLGDESRSLFSVFFGGGTPSLWEPSLLGEVLAAIREASHAADPALEVTVECNPSSLTRKHAEQLRDIGVNRLSIGVQSLRNEHLKFLGRLHDRDLAMRAVSDAVACFDRVSSDVMFGMPDHTIDELRDDVRTLVDLGVSHLSAYALTVEPGTPFGSLHRKGLLRVSDEDTYADLFDQVRGTLSDSGFEHYEVSNYALPGEQSRHNAHYWRGGDYLGIGSSAVGCTTEQTGHARRWKNHIAPQRYMSGATLDELGAIEGEVESLNARDLLREHWMLGLRTAEGVDIARTIERTGLDPTVERSKELEALVREGAIRITDGRIYVPHERWFNLDSIVLRLF